MESVQHMTVSELIRKCPKGVPMKEALERQSRRKRKQPLDSTLADQDAEEEAAYRGAIRGCCSAHGGGSFPRVAGGADGASGAASGAAGAAADGDEDAAGPGPGDDDPVFAPQVRIIDGRIVIDEQSLEITAGRPDARLEEPSLVIEGNSSVTYGTYMNKTPSEKWTAEETEAFYSALSRYGTDFSLIERIMPHRTRRQIKLKFKREEREQPARITAALSRRLPANPTELQAIAAQVQAARAARPAPTAAAGAEAPSVRPAVPPAAPDVPTVARLPADTTGILRGLARNQAVATADDLARASAALGTARASTAAAAAGSAAPSAGESPAPALGAVDATVPTEDGAADERVIVEEGPDEHPAEEEDAPPPPSDEEEVDEASDDDEHRLGVVGLHDDDELDDDECSDRHVY